MTSEATRKSCTWQQCADKHIFQQPDNCDLANQTKSIFSHNGLVLFCPWQIYVFALSFRFCRLLQMQKRRAIVSSCIHGINKIPNDVASMIGNVQRQWAGFHRLWIHFERTSAHCFQPPSRQSGESHGRRAIC